MKRIHLIGIGGSGLSAIALFLKEKGYLVTGSDRSLSLQAKQLANEGITVYAGHDPANVSGVDLVVRSSAVAADNPEVNAAQAAGIPVLKRQEFLAEMTAGKVCLAVAGTHGKTTTTAMLAWVLTCLKMDPSFVIGGVSKNFGRNAHAGQGEWFIIEADEYDYMFLGLTPKIILLTTVEHDHPDCFPTSEVYFDAFQQFVDRLPQDGLLIANAESEGARQLLEANQRRGKTGISYAIDAPADFQASGLTTNSLGGFDFTLIQTADNSTIELVNVSLQVPGRHNVSNALAVLSTCHRLGLPLNLAANALKEFSGTGRRFDVLGEAAGVIVVDDYAHHPTEVTATLAAARARYPRRRIWAVWQPHTFSRTIALLDRFGQAFGNADRVVVTEIYAAREQREGFSAAQAVEKIAHPMAQFIPTLDQVTEHLLNNLTSGDVLLVLSAGDADQVSARVLSGLKEREQQNG
ncbi:MAG: UDP-N-acetylmuramate--L-alanine ligase [Chloroflexota bacterium]